MEWKRQPLGPHVVLTNCFENKKCIIQTGAGGPTKITTSGSRRWWWSVKSSLWETWSRPSVHLVQLKYNDGAENMIEDTCWFSLLLWLWTKHEHSVLYRRVDGIGQQVFFDVTTTRHSSRWSHWLFNNQEIGYKWAEKVSIKGSFWTTTAFCRNIPSKEHILF